MKDRSMGTVVAEVVLGTDKETLKDFVLSCTGEGSNVYKDDRRSYKGMLNRQH